MIEAIGGLERAVSKLERAVEALPEPGAATESPPDSLGVDASGARAALKSLDDLISELKGRTGG